MMPLYSQIKIEEIISDMQSTGIANDEHWFQLKLKMFEIRALGVLCDELERVKLEIKDLSGDVREIAGQIQEIAGHK